MEYVPFKPLINESSHQRNAATFVGIGFFAFVSFLM